MGKTTILFQLLQSMGDSARTVFLFRTPNTPQEFLKGLLADLNIEPSDDVVAMHAQLNKVITEEFERGRRLVILVDEAQALEAPVFETLRMLSNFETPRQKMLQIVLSGQPELAEKLASTGLTQLRQRISIFTKLEPLTAHECGEYILHRLRTAGYSSHAPLFFTARAIALIHKHSQGIPRNINNICFNALSLGFATNRPAIDEDIIREVIADRCLEVPEPKNTIREMFRLRLSFLRKHFDFGQYVAGFLWGAIALLLLLFGAGFAALRLHSKAASRQPATVERPATALAEEPTGSQTLGTATSNATISEPAIYSSPTKPETDLISPTESPAEPATTSTETGYREIQIAPNQTIYGISKQFLGQYDCATREQILALNPTVQDPNVVRAGQTLRLPLVVGRDPTDGCPAESVSMERNSAGVERKQ